MPGWKSHVKRRRLRNAKIPRQFTLFWNKRVATFVALYANTQMRASRSSTSRAVVSVEKPRPGLGWGFAPPGWDGLITKLGRSAQECGVLSQAGLLIDKGAGGFYDRFRNRITFPIRDRRGRTIGFGARALGEDTPKYLNSPETPVFHKGHELYGLYEVRQANRNLERLFVVEGYMDVVSLAQFGISNAVATLGTAATSEHMAKLFRTTPRVIFCFDGDEAGKRAAWRAAETLLPLFKDGWLASFMFLPDGQDPDNMVRAQGSEAFLNMAEEGLSLSAFLFEHLLAQTSLETLDDRARLVELARPLLASIQAPGIQKSCPTTTQPNIWARWLRIV